MRLYSTPERATWYEIPGRIIARARLWTFSRVSARQHGRFANSAHAYSTTDLISEQYTRTRSSVATPLFFSALMAQRCPLAFFITASQCTAQVRSCDIWTPSSLKDSTRLTAKPLNKLMIFIGKLSVAPNFCIDQYYYKFLLFQFKFSLILLQCIFFYLIDLFHNGNQI